MKYRYLAALGVAVLYLVNPLLAATAGFSWNHNLAVLCMLGSLGLICSAQPRSHPGVGYLPAAPCLESRWGYGSASLTILPAYFLALIWQAGLFLVETIPPHGLSLVGGFALALLPFSLVYHHRPAPV